VQGAGSDELSREGAADDQGGRGGLDESLLQRERWDHGAGLCVCVWIAESFRWRVARERFIAHHGGERAERGPHLEDGGWAELSVRRVGPEHGELRPFTVEPVARAGEYHV